MPIKTPKERAFYYEITNLRDRLIYWIPKEDLENLIKKGEVGKDIVKDYPFGLDVEVYQELFDEFKNKYGLKIPFDAADTLQAFHAIKNKYGKKFPRTGFINAKELGSFTRELKSKIGWKLEFRRREMPGIKKKEPDKKTFRKQQMLKRKTAKLIKKSEVKGLDVKTPIQKQNLFRVGMTDGENAIDALSRLHQHKMKGK